MTHALIIGGGIAGAVTAMALQKAGITSVVYEAYPTGADDVGAFLTVMVNGLDALKAIDAHEPVIDSSFPTNTVELLSGTGERLGEMRIDEEQANAPDPRTLKRASLYQVLHGEAARRGIGIQHGKRLTGATVTADGVKATFDDGTQAAGDLLVGADGIHSLIRAIIDPAAPQRRYTGMNTATGYTAVAPVTARPDILTMIYGKRAFFGYTTAPDGEIWWFANAPGPELSKAELAATTTEEWKRRLTDLFSDDDTPAADIVRASGQDIIGSNCYDIPSTPTWYRESMVIVGDALHAVSPYIAQGASMAIESSVVLAKCLRDLPHTQQAFRAYEGLRRERVERVVALSAIAGNAQAPDFDNHVVRDALPKIVRQGRLKWTTWLSEHHIDWDNPVVFDLGAG